MYLGTEIEFAGRCYPMTGVLPITFTMLERPAAHGYTIVEVAEENGFYNRGLRLRGHEFHYSIVSSYNQILKFAFKMVRGRGIKDGYDGVVYRNVFATYTHVHVFGVPQWVNGMLRMARKFSALKGANE